MWWVAANQSSGREVEQHVKSMLRATPFFQKLFQHYGVDPKEAWQIRFRVAPLDGSYAVTHGDEITLDPKIFHRGIAGGMHYVAHELSHWLKHKQEERQYLSDPEEIEGFVWGIAHELSRGVSPDQIEATFTPILRPHFPSDSEAHAALAKMMVRARRLGR